MINGCSISPQPAEEEKEESPDTCTMTMEDYFRQEDAKKQCWELDSSKEHIAGEPASIKIS